MQTRLDPIYQTKRVAPESYLFDVPPGKYEVMLHFAEIVTETTTSIAYNLGDDQIPDHEEDREFHVMLNGKRVLDSFNIRRSYGALRAISNSFIVDINEAGLEVHFVGLKGEPCISAIEIERVINKCL